MGWAQELEALCSGRVTTVRNSHKPLKTGILGLVLAVLCLAGSGCGSYAQPGETALERKVRHRRLLRSNYHQMAEDIDKLLLLDKPSSLSDKRLP